jgi:molybdopterin synthase sulfur carrier subunit
MDRVKVKLFANFREVADRSRVDVELGDQLNLRGLLGELCESFPDLNEELFKGSELSNEVIILKNGRNIIFLDNLNTKLSNGEEIAIFPPVGGG